MKARSSGPVSLVGEPPARRLPFLLKPGDRETPADFLSRLAVRNGRDSLRAICTDFGIDMKALLNGEGSAIEAVARLGHVDGTVLEGSAFKTLGNMRTSFRGQILHNSMTTRRRIRFCPACLREDVEDGSGRMAARPWRRAEWLIPDLGTCPTHSLTLVDLGQGSRSDHFDFSRVMADWLPHLGGFEHAADRCAVTGFERYLHDRLNAPVARRGSEGWLEDFPLYAVIRFCELVGMVAVDGVDAPDHKQRDAVTRLYQQTGFDAVADGETAFRQFLSDILSSYDGRLGKRGPQVVFGRLYKWLAHAPRDPAYAPIRQVLSEFWLDTMAVGPGEMTAPFGWPVTRRRLHSIRSASVEFGIDRLLVRKILVARGIARPTRAGLTDDMVTFDAAANESFLHDLADAVPLDGAAAHLDVREPQARALVRAGMITPIAGGNKDEGARQHFRVADLDAFVRELIADAAPAGASDPGLVDIRRAAKRTGRSIVSIIELLRDGRLGRARHRLGARGLSAIMLDVEVIVPRAPVAPDRGLLVSEATAASGIHPHVLRALAREGIIRSNGGRGAADAPARFRLDREDFAQFRQDYVSLAELASQRDLSWGIVRNWLQKKGIEPAAFSPKVGAVFYRVDDVGG